MPLLIGLAFVFLCLFAESSHSFSVSIKYLKSIDLSSFGRSGNLHRHNQRKPPTVMMEIATASNSENREYVAMGNNDEKWKVGDGSRWRVWSVIDELETNGLSSSKSSSSRKRRRSGDYADKESTLISDNATAGNCDKVTRLVIDILKEWGGKWAGQSGWQTLLNKKSLLHEVEESIVALQILMAWMDRRIDAISTEADTASDTPNIQPVTLCDVCCGKGIFSMLASYLFRGKTSTHVSDIIMLDKQTDIDWNHIVMSNLSAEEEGRPRIETWGGCNLHDIDEIVARLEAHGKGSSSQNPHNTPGRQLALVGIHLCKQLSPSCAGVVNSLGPEKCPFLCLAPCCLPRVARNVPKMISNDSKRKGKSGKELGLTTVTVRTFETLEEKQARLEANERRDGAKKRSVATQPCYLCQDIGHPMHKCSLLPSDEFERLDVFRKAAAATPCWKCGEVGHFKADCPSTQSSSKPRLTLPPAIELDVASILFKSDSNDGSQCYVSPSDQQKAPFESYCDLLATTLQRDSIEVLDSGLVNNSAQHNNPANAENWNRGRKSIFIVASS
mmetsp:Transcript_12077/g.24879  ORF Transcript_12077/g.24879 Transcript_12077/m.24879 type:complete len:558 (-) Transcript_12077:99-1772(-)